jgi:hypothetical protein
MSLVIRNARVRGQQQQVDIAIEGERIAAVGPTLPVANATEIDAGGSLVLPGLFNLHFHADKCLLGEIMRPNQSGTLPEAIEITNDFKRNYDPAEVAQRAVRACEIGILNGTTFFRLFADVGTIGGLRAARGLLLAREKLQKYCRVQVVAFPQEGIVRDPGAAELMEEAIKEGCDIVGGLPWYEYSDADARAHIDICFEIATISTSTCWSTTPTTPIRAAWNISRSRPCAKAMGGAWQRAIAARWPATTTSMPPRSSTWWRPPASPSRSTRTSIWSARRASTASPNAEVSPV